MWHGAGDLRLEAVGDPDPEPGEVVLRPTATGVCGSDLEGYAGHQPNRAPGVIMGHELAGEVVAAGTGAGVPVGTTVAVNPLVTPPGAAPDVAHLDPARELIGVHRPGGFAERVRVPAGQVRVLPAGTDPRLGALAEPLANGVHAARLGRGGVEGGHVARAVVVGAGAIGLCALQGLRLAGVGEVVAVERDPARRALAGALGAAAALDVGDPLDEGAWDVVVDAVGLPVTRRRAVELTRPGGCAVLLGLADDAAPVDLAGVVRRGVTLRGAYAYRADDYDAALAHLLAGRAGLGPLEPVLPLAEGPAQFAELARGPSGRVRAFLAP